MTVNSAIIDDGGTDLLQHLFLLSEMQGVTTRSIALMPMNGTMMPPTP
jgi:hypothetical protein